MRQVCPVGYALLMFESFQDRESKTTLMVGKDSYEYVQPKDLLMLNGTTLVATDKVVYFVGGGYD
jgi:hypothetical protein